MTLVLVIVGLVAAFVVIAGAVLSRGAWGRTRPQTDGDHWQERKP